MDAPSSDTVARVKSVLLLTLGIEERDASIDASTPLFGSLPEFDSMAVVSVVLAIEQEFAITIPGDELTADMFETIGTLATFIDVKLG